MSFTDRDNITRQIRDAVDIVALIEGYVSLKRVGGRFKGLCPFHQEKTPSFHVNPLLQTFYCFGCQAGGDIFKFIQLKENVGFVEARRILADRAGISLEQESRASAGGPGKSDLAKVNEWAQRFFRRNYLDPSAGQQAREYVDHRGISTEMAEAFGLGLAVNSFDSLIRQAGQSRVDMKLLVAAGLAKERQQGGYYDTFRHRLMFPIVDAAGRIIGFGGRTLGDDPAKYLNTPATPLFDKGSQLFGLDRARHAIGEAGRVIVVEGYTDCMMCHQFGFRETVATLGTAMTDAHAAMLRRYTDRVILLFDSDEAGKRAADRALSVTLGVGLDVYLTRVPDGKDPCDYLLSAGKSGFECVLKGAVGALESKWQQVAREYDASASGPGRRRAIEAFLKDLSIWTSQGAVDAIQQGLLLNQLSRVLSLPADVLYAEMQRLSRRSGATASGGASGAAPRRDGVTRSTSDEQEALKQIIEVLLNEPHRYEEVAECFDPSAISDPALASIGRALAEMLGNNGSEGFRVDDFHGRFESPEYGRRISELQVRGERRGGYAVVIAGAKRCLESVRRVRQAAALTEQLKHAGRAGGESTADSASLDEDARLLALAEAAKNPHFAPVGARRRFLEG